MWKLERVGGITGSLFLGLQRCVWQSDIMQCLSCHPLSPNQLCKTSAQQESERALPKGKAVAETDEHSTIL